MRGQDILMTGAIGVVFKALNIDPEQVRVIIEGCANGIQQGVADIAALRQQLDVLQATLDQVSDTLHDTRRRLGFDGITAGYDMEPAEYDTEPRPDGRGSGLANGHDTAASAVAGGDRTRLSDPASAGAGIVARPAGDE